VSASSERVEAPSTLTLYCHDPSPFSLAELLQPKPPDARSDEVVWKIRPTESGSQNSPADEVAPQIFKKEWMPQLKEFRSTGLEQYDSRNFSSFQTSAKEINHQAPEDLVEYSAE
jgi:hypothetical protein